ncbi:MAG: DUF3859 domain-containing protein [Symploca sp. SIO2E6]|nr:DUF3859 domain-containing protein [Symploca sp. SIO2E6]
MEQRLTKSQLTQIVAEVERLSQRQQEELDAAEVREILAELNLQPELLEEAMIQLRRREALTAQKRRHRWLISAVAIVLSLAIVSTIFWTQHRQQTLARILVEQDRITLRQDDGSQLSTVSRQAASELFYRVTLTEAPVGQKLSLSCNWHQPSGGIVHQNRYQTKQISTSIWNTYCRYTIGTTAPTGTWKVEMLLGDRLLSDATFEVISNEHL